MSDFNIVVAHFGHHNRVVMTDTLYQYDYGQKLKVEGITTLPQTFQAHFSNVQRGGVSITVTGINGMVDVPNSLLMTGKRIYCWIYVTETGSGETVYQILMPVQSRPMPEYYDVEDAGVFDSVVNQVAEYAATATTGATSATASATAAAGSATAAAASASAAADSAENAAASEANAEASASAAQASDASAATAASTAVSAKTAAVAAQTAAEAAQDAAEDAQEAAEAAQTAAETAAASATADAATASTKATAAAASATTASTKATDATNAATTATAQAVAAEAAKTTAVEAKTAAQSAQSAAETAATTATAKATEAAASATAAAQAAASINTPDSALSDTSTNAVQNRVITSEITDVKSAIEKNCGIDILDGWESGYYASGSSATSIDINTRTSNASFVSIAIPCQPGDVFVYTGTGTTSARNWALLSSASGANNIVSKAAAGSYEDNVITIPDGVAYIVFNASKNYARFVTKGDYLVKQVDDNTAKASGAISALKAISQSGTGSVPLADMAYCTGIRATGATGLTVSTAQLCESKYPGASSQNGVSFRRNDDGSYTINGTATGSANFHINQSTRTGTDNPITLSGKYTLSVEKMGGSYDNGSYIGASSLIFGIKSTSSATLMTVTWGRAGDTMSKSQNITSTGAYVFVQIANGVTYNNLTFRVMLNSGDTVLPWSPYKAAVSATLDDVVAKVNSGYLPNAIITATPATTDIVAVGVAVVSDGDEESAQIDVYGVLEKYNGRMDTLAQLFNRPLFLIYTDIHGNEVNLNRINTWYKGNKPVYVRDVYCLGDMVDDQATDPITQFESIDIWGKTLKVIGNHDVLVSGTLPGITAVECYNKYIAPDVASWDVTQPSDAATEGKSYYYKDYGTDIRVIVLDTYYYTTAQHTWFVNTLADARTNNLSVIVMQHEDICTPAEKQPLNADYPFAKKQGGYTVQYRTYGDGGNYQTKRAAVDDFIGAGGKFICWLSGHTHADETGTYDGGTHGKQLSVTLSNASNSQTSSVRVNGYSQDCFTYIGVDTSLGYIYLLRIGVDVDKWFHQNLFLCYDYVNHAVVEYH